MVKQNKQSKLPQVTLIIASLALAVGLVASYAIFSSMWTSQGTDDINAQYHFENTMRLLRLEECYEHNIHPCSQEAIAKYHEAHPEE